MKISIIAAISDNNVIGNKGRIPWHLPEDLKRFKSLTQGHHILMGRITHESIGRPLPGRINLVITKNRRYSCHKECQVVDSLTNAIKYAQKAKEKEAYIIGGGGIYKQSLPLTTKMYLTRIRHNFKGDTFFPKLKKSEWIETYKEKHKKDKVNKYESDFIILKKRMKETSL